MLLTRDGYTNFFASDRNLLTKNTGLCFRFSSSLNKAALTETLETVR